MPGIILTGAELENHFGPAVVGVAPQSISGAYTDSRQDGSGKIFFALKGERFDAHNFLAQAVSSHAAALCVEKSKTALASSFQVPVFAVDDTLLAYQKCANLFRRKNSGLKVFGVTGSVGKTSVKEMLRAISVSSAGSEKFVLATEGNTNNQIGVPQNLFRLTMEHRFAVIEMGTSSPGEISPLSCCALPDVALVNSIAPCHLEKLHSLAGVAAEKGTISSGLPPSGCGVIPFDCPERAILEKSFAGHQILTFGESPESDVQVEYLGGDLTGSRFSLRFPDQKKYVVEWHLSGRHQALNAASASAAAWAAGISAEAIVAGLPQVKLPGMRMKKTLVDGVTYINDAYNANPASMTATLKQLSEAIIDDSKLVLLLGGMRELGEISVSAHRQIMELARKLFPHALIITVGSEFDNSPGDRHFPASAMDILAGVVNFGDTVFAKGSRGIALEKALPEAAR